MRRLAVASAILATLLIAFPGYAPNAAAAPPRDSERAASALRYLVSLQRADGSIDGSIGETADLVIGAAANGYDPATLAACSGKTALTFLGSASDAAATDAGKTAKAILAVRAAHLDAASFEGRNLVARLDALYHATTGAYGDGGTFSQSLAILALGLAGRPVPAAAVTRLAALQDTDGSWNFQAASNSTAGDTNSTAIALMALAAAGNHAGEAKAFAYLHTQQLADGGFPYQNSSTFGPPASDPDSDAVVLQALIATGQDPTAAVWSKGTKDVLTHLRSTQAANGGFVFPGSPGPNGFTTSQVPAALAGKPYGVPLDWTAGRAIPRPACRPAVTPSASPRSTTAGRTAVPTPPVTATGGGSTGSEGDAGISILLLVVAAGAVGAAGALLARRNARG